MAAGVASVLLAGCSDRPPDDVITLRSAEVVAGDGSMKKVTLPHSRPRGTQHAALTEYRFTLPAAERAADGLGVFVTASTAPLAAFVNDAPVFQNGDLRSPPIQYLSWRASPSFQVPAQVLRHDRNTLVLRAYDNPVVGARLLPVLVGPPAAVERWALREGLVHHGLPALISAALIGIGLISLSLWRGRRDNHLFLLLASGALIWGVQGLLMQMPSAPLPPRHQSALLLSMYVWFPMLVSVFFMRFAYVHWRIYEFGAATLALAAPALVYLGQITGTAAAMSAALRGAAIVWISIALGAVFRFALRDRSAKGILLLAAGICGVAFAIRDYIVTWGPTEGRVVFLTNYSGLALMVLAGWMLVERYHSAYSAAVASNVDLERRLRRANAELAQRLEQVQLAREQAEQASLAKSRFFAAASHDLRQPLHSLGLFAAALEGHVQSSDARDLVARIGDSIAALESLFNELLDLSKLDAGAVTVKPRSVAVQDMFDRLSLEFHAESMARHLRLRFVPTRLAVYADPVLVERVLSNLVSNALRYTASGGVVIGARRRGQSVLLEVCDTGVGIAPELHSQVFDEFFQVGNPGRDRRQGLGLGLAIVRRLVTLMGHPLVLNSIPGKGTRFRLLLPRAYAVEEPAPAAPQPDLDAFAGRRVLLVEDDPDIRRATAALLTQWGLAVVTCKSRDEAERALDDGWVPDLALVDLRLAALDDGIDVVEHLRRRLDPQLPAVLLSGDTGAADLARVRTSGLPLLTKPVAPARLKATLHAYLTAVGAAHVMAPAR